MEKVGCYIHIPFCHKKCYYCDFCAYMNVENRIDNYINNLTREIELYQDKLCVDIDSIYLGGGTPSYIDSKYIESIVKTLHNFNLDNLKEFTIECNPNSINKDKLLLYKDLGINRISLGVQSFDDEVLRSIGRDHSSEIAISDIELIRNTGFDNLSFDLMLNLPNQDYKSIKNDLNIVKSISPEHISWYSLIVEEGSRFYTLNKKGKLNLMDDDIEVDIFDELIENLDQIGLKRYEISNFAKKGFESYHNKKYWEGNGYIAFGMSAAGYLGNYRYNNTKNFIHYNNMINKNKLPIENIEIIESQEKEIEYIIFKLREISGINLKAFKDKFGVDFIDKYEDEINQFIDLDYFIIDDNFRFSKKGMDLSNQFLSLII
ncbi:MULTISPECIES: radical SAM family heme chaperone HemW [Anaerococcus]|uniref:radical SAM family heme chaperone HemW n=2 Tax=Peptoniphilaceae TaxID=1570339 RepID=UPI001AE5C390|nr:MULTISPECIES: radical SAM family heme chaperone HemW [Anaerococcus]MBP2069441.1 oxygen-independent coproporphyrinogen-3 oxidase [Anaerococcus nagyae]MDU1864304.1 radical SAM family heme chaperone HemW [Anaerococcus sp.]MDU3211534.1 radical SAM family heme chaperone HemW [Anaerococcus sp.]